MSVCASANLFSSRKVSPPSRRPLAENERWAALNKNIFQDILNAILFQTPFSPGGVVGGKRHHRTEISLRSLSPPPFFTGSGGSGTSIVDCKEDVGLESFEDRGLDTEIPIGVESNPQHRTPDRCWSPRGSAETTERGMSELEETPGSQGPSRVGGNKSEAKSSRDQAGHGRMEISDALCSFRRPESRPDAASCGTIGPSYRLPSTSKSSHFSLYCEKLLANVPMMIIGLRSFRTSDEKNPDLVETTSGFSIHPDSTAAKFAPPRSEQMEKASAVIRSNSGSSLESNSYLLTGICVRDFDMSGSPNSKLLKRFDSDHPLPSPNQLQPVPTGANNNDDVRQQKTTSSSSPYHHNHSQLHHTHTHSELTRKPGDDQGDRGGSSAAKTSRDHSILTILGLLSSDDHDDDQRKSTGSSRPASVSCGAGETKRLLGIGVTVTGASRWMAVDKDIVYDMIDQVLNGERDRGLSDLYTSRPSVVTSSSGNRPRPGDRKRGTAGVRRPSLTAPGGARCQGFALLPRGNERGARRESSGTDLVLRHGRQQRCSREQGISSADSMVSLLQQKHKKQVQKQHRPVICQPPAGAYDPSPAPLTLDPPPTTRERHAGPADGLEGVSVLRSLLSDDPGDAPGDIVLPSIPKTASTTPSSSSSSHEVRDSTPEVTSPPPGDERSLDLIETSESSAFKRSRQSTKKNNKKRRTADADLTSAEPYDLGSCPLTFGASPNYDQSSSSCRSSLSMKWKSSMLMRMRNEEASENEAGTCHSSSSLDGTL